MEAVYVTAIVLRQLLRWYSHPNVQDAHRLLTDVGVRAMLAQLERVLLELESLFPGLTEQVISAAAMGAATREQVVMILKDLGVPEPDIELALAGAAR